MCALSIAGLDPGGGAGILADLRAFEAAGAFGCAAVAVVTVQSTSGVRSVRAAAAREVVAEAREVLRVQRVRAIKIGALGSAANVRAVAALLREPAHARLPVVIDTVMLPTRGGSRLLAVRGVNALATHLVPRATLVTANALEASALTGLPVASVDDARRAAAALVAMGARAALVKGGHLDVRKGHGRDREAVTDVLAIGHHDDSEAERAAASMITSEVLELRAPRLALGRNASRIHGGGCALASLIAGRMAHANQHGTRGITRDDIHRAVRWAKKAHHMALSRAVDVGGTMRVLVFGDNAKP